ncbi:MAG: pentapeptide repeat-containing protein [Microcoleus sp.]
MPAILPDMRSLDFHNKYPDCLRMQLEAIPVPSDATASGPIELYLSLNFNECWKPLLGGRVKFGLQGGRLNLNLENCKFPLTARQLIGDFKLLPTETTSGKIDDNECTVCHISTTGGDTTLSWMFALKQGKPPLKGFLKSAKLGELAAQIFQIKAVFSVSKEDVYLADFEGLWPHDITPNQHSVLERILAIDLVENNLQPALSWGVLCYDSPQVEQQAAEISSQAESNLQEKLDRIIATKTDNFAELANIANLNLADDFAGANLLGTSLNGVDFSSAKLDRTNFRGAVLTDADFSEASLQNAKFSGADLSGAFLGNADLQGADLYKASLALANLSGANLCGANLMEVNLTNANFSGANVESARFGNNSGLGEEMQANLQQRGAIFEHI